MQGILQSVVILPNAFTFLAASSFIKSGFCAGYRKDISVPSDFTFCTSFITSGRTFKIISENEYLLIILEIRKIRLCQNIGFLVTRLECVL